MSPYRIMYRRKEDVVEIAAIRHQAREFDEERNRPLDMVL